MKIAPIKPLVAKEALDQLDVRVGTILAIDDVPESDRLLAFKVDFGDHTRTILVGMKRERDDPQSLVGMQTVFVVNLPPRTMRGVVSEGMLLDVGYADGVTPALLRLERAVPNGVRVG